MRKPSAVLGVDIGGTKTKAGAVALDAEGHPARLVLAQELPTPRLALPAFYDAIAALIQDVSTRAEATTRVLPLAAVVHPGRFLADGTLARGTTPNLGAEPDQFDGAHPSRELERRLRISVVAENDAVAQMRYGLAVLLQDPAIRPHLLGQTVVYIGPGTGMGGGVARVNGAGGVVPVTDGHLFDVRVPGYGDGLLTAEELLTGPAIARRVVEANSRLREPIEPARGGRLDELLLMGAAPPEQRAIAEAIADTMGGILAALIETLCAGTITKVRLERPPGGGIRRHVDEADRAWPAADQAIIRQARRFIFGGFLGCSRGLGRRVTARALDALRARGLSDVAIFQIPAESGDAGVLGIAAALRPEQIRQAIDRLRRAG